MEKTNLKVSIIIPVHEEREIINNLLQRLKKQNNNYYLKEIIIVDSNGNTIQVINSNLIKWDKLLLFQGKSKGRAAQMNFGASKAKGDILLFLHADCILPKNALKLIYEMMMIHDINAGAFNSDYKTDKKYLKLYVKVANFWAKITQRPLGDQGIFVRREIFEKLNGYRTMPIFEEFEFISRLKKKGLRIKFVNATIIANSRRFDNCFICQVVKNRILTVMYYLGFDTKLLAKMYK